MYYFNAAILTSATGTSHAICTHTYRKFTNKAACSGYCLAILSQNLPSYNPHPLVLALLCSHWKQLQSQFPRAIIFLMVSSFLDKSLQFFQTFILHYKYVCYSHIFYSFLSLVLLEHWNLPFLSRYVINKCLRGCLTQWVKGIHNLWNPDSFGSNPKLISQRVCFPGGFT